MSNSRRRQSQHIFGSRRMPISGTLNIFDRLLRIWRAKIRH